MSKKKPAVKAKRKRAWKDGILRTAFVPTPGAPFLITGITDARDFPAKKKPARRVKRVPMPEPFMDGSANMMCREFLDGSRDIATGTGRIEDVPAAVDWLQRAQAWKADAPKKGGR